MSSGSGKLVDDALREFEDELGRDFDLVHNSIRSKVDYLPIEKEYSPLISWMVLGALLGPALFLVCMLFVRVIRAVSIRQALFLGDVALVLFFSAAFLLRAIFAIDPILVLSSAHRSGFVLVHLALFATFISMSLAMLFQGYRNRHNIEGAYMIFEFGIQATMSMDYYQRVWVRLEETAVRVGGAEVRLDTSVYGFYLVLGAALLYMTGQVIRYRKETNPLQDAAADFDLSAPSLPSSLSGAAARATSAAGSIIAPHTE
mmetsp:Transcript_10773/g.22916  ORF Transcript_10773/g.22916 Transcript_10773/m.22916 type:complete len:259 (-) Transcript_10773:1085-1861(-)